MPGEDNQRLEEIEIGQCKAMLDNLQRLRVEDQARAAQALRDLKDDIKDDFEEAEKNQVERHLENKSRIIRLELWFVGAMSIVVAGVVTIALNFLFKSGGLP